MSRVVANDLDPDAINLCFCPNCMQLGGPRRAALKAAYLAAARRTIEANVPDADRSIGVDVQRRRERQRQWVLNNPEAERAKRQRSHAKEAARRAELKARKAQATKAAA